MDEQKIINRTLQKIKQEHITPEPGWKLHLHYYLFWGVFVAMLVLSAISFSMAFHLAWDMDWDIYEYIRRSRVVFFFNALPYFWIILLVIFALICYKNLRHTQKGYRYSRFFIAAIVIGGTLAVGSLFYLAKASESINQAMAEKLPYVHSILPSREKVWNQPEMGLLAGEIVGADESKIDLVDFRGQKWNILPDENTVVRHMVILQVRDKIKVIGKNEAPCCNFIAKEIRPWECKEKTRCADKNKVRKYMKKNILDNENKSR